MPMRVACRKAAIVAFLVEAVLGRKRQRVDAAQADGPVPSATSRSMASTTLRVGRLPQQRRTVLGFAHELSPEQFVAAAGKAATA